MTTSAAVSTAYLEVSNCEVISVGDEVINSIPSSMLLKQNHELCPVSFHCEVQVLSVSMQC